MPKRNDLKKILIIGSGPIVIGQASEFDYSGTQAVKALKEEGYEVILINSNPATIMTDPEFADRVYIEPITLPYLTKVIELERPDALLPTVGGQTALNAALELDKAGILNKYNVELIGAKIPAIEKAEKRDLFKSAMEKIGASNPKSGYVSSLEEAQDLLEEIGLPAILRPSFTLGGSGGGIAYNKEEYNQKIQKALHESPSQSVLVEQSVIGWKEYELEVMRDLNDNVVIICSIENLDAMGIHTGDSITIAPQQTLSDKEYQKLRDLGIAIIREIGVETGGSNIQFAVNPKNGDILVIEMNPRVSRSSALASKATGFPIAKIAAKLSVGFTLDEIANDITEKTPASFEPVLDYIVTKIPRFTFEKFPDSENRLDTQMRSVGEAMALGRTFGESFQKAIRSLETGRDGWGADGNIDIPLRVLKKKKKSDQKAFLKKNLVNANDERIFFLREAFLSGFTIDELYDYTGIDPWFLYQLKRLIDFEELFKKSAQKNASALNKEIYKEAKQFGYSDRQLGFLMREKKICRIMQKLAKIDKGSKEFIETSAQINDIIQAATAEIRKIFNKMEPVYKRIDTCAAEFESYTPYLYSSYDQECEAEVSDKEKVLILGGGPNRIGQGIEFDYCCCHASFSLQDMNIESIMVNSNPETVSTDYDTSDRLYFEPLTEESILNIYQKEKLNGTVKGVILQFGGQTPLKLASFLQKENIPVLGTSPENIHKAEDRDKFNQMIKKLNLRQPKGHMASSLDEALKKAEKIGYPVLVRPSYVLGGRAMMIVHNREMLLEYMKRTTEISKDRPVLIDEFLQNAVEIDVDAISDGETVFIAGIMEHIEEAGVHSGDSACILPPKSIDQSMIQTIKNATSKIALELNVIGLLNIQYAIAEEILYVLEVNPRASRTVPFVSKAIGIPLTKRATEVMTGKKLKDLGLIETPIPDLFHVKEVVLPFKKFSGVDSILGPEMKSTGEVMGIGKTPAEAFYKAQEASGFSLPSSGKIFISVTDTAKNGIMESVKKIEQMGYKIIATKGTHDFFNEKGIPSEKVMKVHEGRPHIVDLIKSGEIDLIVNIPRDIETRNDALEIRLAALQYGIPYFTTLAAVVAAFEGMVYMKEKEINVYPL